VLHDCAVRIFTDELHDRRAQSGTAAAAREASRTADAARADGAGATDEARVRALDDQERLAALQRDVPALERFWSEELTVNAPNSRVVAGRQAVMETFVQSQIINFSRFDRTIEFIRADGRFVFIMGLETVTPMNDAPSAGLVAGRTIRRRFTNIWKNENGEWRLFARHANVIATP
jgi:ketosteroid isomerase-like protein